MNKIHAQCAHTPIYKSLSLSQNIPTLLRMEFEGGSRTENSF